MTANEFNRTVIPLGEKLYRFGYRYLRDAELTRDAVQDVFIKLWNQRDVLQTINSLEAFAIRVTRNHCLDIIKSRRTVSLDENDYFKERISDDSDPEKELFRSDSLQRIKLIIDDLSEPHKSVILLKDVEGYSNDEVGKALGLTEGNIRVILSRARKKVRAELEKIYVHGTEKNKNIVAEIL